MSVQLRTVRWRLVALVVSLLLPAVLITATPAAAATAPPAAAATANCSPEADAPGFWTEGWRIYIEGSGFASCGWSGTVEVLVREDKSGWWDRTVASGWGGMNERVRATAPCDPGGYRNYYTEVRVNFGGREYKVQSHRVRMNADCG